MRTVSKNTHFGRVLSNFLVASALGCIVLSGSAAAYQSYVKVENRRNVVMKLEEIALKQHRWQL